MARIVVLVVAFYCTSVQVLPADNPQFITEPGKYEFFHKNLVIQVKVDKEGIHGMCSGESGPLKGAIFVREPSPGSRWFIYPATTSTVWLSDGKTVLERATFTGGGTITMSTENFPDLYKSAPKAVRDRYLAQRANGAKP